LENFWIALLLTLFAGLATGIGSALAFFTKLNNYRFLEMALKNSTMNTFIKLPLNLFILFLAFLLTGCDTSDDQSNNGETKNTIVVLKFKAQPDKGTKAVSELIKLLEKVKHEPHFVSIKLHVDPNDKTNIMLYEEWDDVSYYNSEHMETDHIKEFMSNSSSFLVGPPDISFWNVVA